jgi:mono/diheme cytochrome c family protein
MVRRIIPLLIVIASAQGAWGQQRDPAPGRRIAERDCTLCHEVRPGETGPSPRASAPPFQLVARTPSTTELSLRVFLRTSHAGMPNILLSEAEIDDLVAYVMSMAPPGK